MGSTDGMRLFGRKKVDKEIEKDEITFCENCGRRTTMGRYCGGECKRVGGEIYDRKTGVRLDNGNRTTIE